MFQRRRGPADELRDLPLFADCPADVLSSMAQLGEETTITEGHDLVREGHGGGRLTVLLEGTADVHVSGSRVRALGPGDVVGEIAMVLGGRSTATVVATSPVRVLTLSPSATTRIFSQSPELRAKIEHQAWERLQHPPQAPGKP
jgi:CRP-like cAMP-binding protein